MPRGDRTGPMGYGPMTGRRAGYCAGYSAPGFANAVGPSPYTGFGFRGGGHGRRNMFYATGLPGWQRFANVPQAPLDEVETLKAQANLLKDQLSAIDKRLADLEKS